MMIAQATITNRARVTVMAVERSTPKRRATTAVSRWLIPIVTAVINPKTMPVNTWLTASYTERNQAGQSRRGT